MVSGKSAASSQTTAFRGGYALAVLGTPVSAREHKRRKLLGMLGAVCANGKAIANEDEECRL
jgi:hypothetical protein